MKIIKQSIDLDKLIAEQMEREDASLSETALQEDDASLKSYSFEFTVDGIKSSRTVNAKSMQEGEELVRKQYGGQNVVITSRKENTEKTNESLSVEDITRGWTKLKREDYWEEDDELAEPYMEQIEKCRKENGLSNGTNEELKMDESIIPGVEEGWKQLVEHSEEDFVDKAEEADQIEANVGIAELLSNLIQGEWQTINDYNVAIKNARAEGLDDVADIMANIVKDENTHVGNLETAMKLVTNEARHIEDGEKEAEEIIDGNEELGIEPNNEFDLSLADDDVDELSRLLVGLGM